MQKGTTLFYYDHIKSNIKNVDKRTNTFVNLRIEFLKSYCQPIQAKIKTLYKEIQYYKHLIENQNQMIQNQPDIFRLKQQIAQFLNTQSYFQSHLDEYQKRVFSFQQQNQNLTQKINQIKKQIQVKINHKQSQFYTDLINNNSNFRQNQMDSSDSVKQEYMSSKNKKSRLSFLPKIFKVDKYFVNKQTANIQNFRNNQTKKQTFFKKSMTSPIYSHQQQQQHLHSDQLNNPQQTNTTTIKQQIITKIKQFDNTEIFFKECFEKKKHQIQKFVSQLQSKLITNRQKFLQICLAVNKNQKIEFQLFKQLSGDQIMTLFISFSWLGKAFFDQLLQKRKKIIQIKSKLTNCKI